MFLKKYELSFCGRESWKGMERYMGRHGENVHFIGDVLNGCSLGGKIRQ